MTDYSQNGEQVAILAWARRKKGSFIDLGAYDGATYSNTAALADLGWPGVCVEAAPNAAALCALRYADRPDVRVMVAAFDPTGFRGVLPLNWSVGGEWNGIYSALEPNPRSDIALVDVEVACLPPVWFAEQLEALPRPRFCSIDIEGQSISALSWMRNYAELDCVCVEANNDGDREAVAEILDGWDAVALPDNHTNVMYTAGAGA